MTGLVLDGRVIYIFRKGGREGPFSSQALHSAVRIGSIDRNTAAMVNGSQTWRTVGQILDEFPQVAPKRTPVPAPVQAPVVPGSTWGAATGKADQTVRPKAQRVLVVGGTLAGVFLALLVLAAFAKSGNRTPVEGSDEEVAVEGGAHEESSSEGGSPGSPVFARDPEDQRKSVLMLRTPYSSSTGFVTKVDGEYFVYTSVHCIDSEEVEFIDHLGMPVPVREPVEVVAASSPEGVDIARMRLAGRPQHALEMAQAGGFAARQDVFALGDSGGEGVLLSLPGKIIGVGPFKVEVDCEFVPGNSGGPIVTAEGQVVGIASYMTADRTIWARGTQHAVRRFGWIPGREYDWEPMSLRQLVREKQLAENGFVTTWLLSVIAELQMTENGFEGMAEVMGDRGLPIEEETFGNHPLVEGFIRTNEALAALPAGDSRDAFAVREYLRFLRSCVVFAEGEMVEFKGLRSAFWQGNVQEDPGLKLKVVTEFGQLVEAYARNPRFGFCLVD
jgi:hypothetical protein